MNPRVAIVDSGVNAGHPHVGALFAGARVQPASDGTPVLANGTDAARDEIGHGTACAGLVRWLAPDAEIVAVRIFDSALRVDADRLAPALRFCLALRCQVVNLSLGAVGTVVPGDALDALGALLDAGAFLVCAAGPRLEGWPASDPQTLAVAPDLRLASDQCGIIECAPFSRPKPLYLAAPYPRPMPGQPRERNLAGSSFAAATLSAILARALATSAAPLDPTSLPVVRYTDLDAWKEAHARAVGADPADER